MLDTASGLVVEQQPRHVRTRIVPRRIGGVLGDANRAEIDVGVENAFLVRRELLGERTAVGPVDRGKAAAGMQQRMLVGPVADFLHHRLRHRRARRQHEAGALHRVHPGRGVVDLRAQGEGERVIQRETWPRRHMHLLVLGVHGVFRQRLQMLPATQRTKPPDAGAIMDSKIAAVAFAIDGAFGVGRPQLAPPGDGLAIGAEQPLGEIETAAIPLRQPEHRRHPGSPDGASQLVGLRAVIGERVVEIALHEAAADRPGRRIHPDVPGVARDKGLRKSDQLGAVFGGLFDQPDRLVDGAVEVEPDRRSLDHGDLVLRMFDAHAVAPLAQNVSAIGRSALLISRPAP